MQLIRQFSCHILLSVREKSDLKTTPNEHKIENVFISVVSAADLPQNGINKQDMQKN
jgi:hypothetical protein